MHSTRRPRIRRGLGVAAAASLVTVLAACSAGGGGASTATPDAYKTPSSDISASLTYAFWDATQQKAIEANLAGFKKLYPNVTVNLDVTPWETYWQKIQTEASSNTLPDLFWLNGPNIDLYAANDKVDPITDEVSAGAIDTSNYPKSLVDLYNYEGVQYGVPKDFDTVGLWYNKDLLSQAGVEAPTADWTWSDLTTAAQKVSDSLGSKGIYGVAAGMDGQTTYYNTIFQAGGSVVSADGKTSGYDTPETQAGLTFWTDLIASKASPSIQQLTDTPADQWFVNGKVAFYYGGSWARSEIADSSVKDEVGVAPLPKGAQEATVIHGVSNVVSENSQNKQAAKALQVYLASKEAQQQQGDMGAVIPAYNGTQSDFADSYPGVDLQVFLDEVAVAKPLPVSKNTSAWNAFETAILPKVFAGTVSVTDGTKDLAEQMNAALAKE